MQALAKDLRPLYALLGLHRGYVGKRSDVSLDQLQQALERHPAKVVAVGESVWISLATIRNLEAAVTLFDEQLKLAGNAGIRQVILHSRRTHDKLAIV
ncbi:TatD family hydrolase [Shigella flexneri]